MINKKREPFKKGDLVLWNLGGGPANSLGLVVETISPTEEVNIPWIRIISPTSGGTLGPYLIWVGRCELISRLDDSLK